jgi:hypothetical protein
MPFTLDAWNLPEAPMPKGRVCAHPGCTTILNCWNREATCSLHTPKDESLSYCGYTMIVCPGCGEVLIKKPGRKSDLCRRCARKPDQMILVEEQA